MTFSPKSPEQFIPVPLKEVKGFMMKPVEGADPVRIDVDWGSLSSIEQNLTQLILDGKYGDAYELSGRGQAKTYDRNLLSSFLKAVADQHDKSLAIAFTNDNVRNVLQG